MLNVDGDDALKAIETGSNLFITGPAGSGKTHLIKEFAKKSEKNVALTATTGIAALNLGGETVHRFLGIGIANRPEQIESVVKRLLKFKNSSKPWEKAKWQILQSLDILIIDEVSMLRRDQFELIESVLSMVRNDPRPFGGVQIILVGDFFQLPPVVTITEEKHFPDLSQPYCFQSQTWQYGKFYSINLTTNYRQSDQDFLNILNSIRIGKVSSSVRDAMSSRINAVFNSNIQPVKLFSHKADVASENRKCLVKINESKYISEAEYTGKPANIDALKRDSQAEDKLYFCKGAQVMMINNDANNKWVNGSIGIILDSDPVLVKLANGNVVAPEPYKWEKIIHKVEKNKWKTEVVASMTQYPFILSYATTIHRSQGLTLDYAEMDLSKIFTYGQCYVALSRVKTIDGLNLIGWNDSAIMTDPIVLKFYGYT